ncbi:hypothetical protein JTB14_038142 [Gonioctena quinquepunctata]|nr:hypothetical protein JTB14_038142 [Gonioctena quinquepunctata]
MIKLITKTSEVAEHSEGPGLTKHMWLIDTKYYTAKVNLVGLEDDPQRCESFANKIEGLIILMDANKQSGLEDLRKWDFFENHSNLEVKLLVSNYCNNDTKITKNEALEWCLKRSFEFIELYPSNIEHNKDDLIEEKFGVERVVEALQSHTWSNLVMKTKDKSNQNMEHKSAQNASNLHMMKDSLQNMPMNQRKHCAEQMVTAFWDAIGGEEEELLDL